MISPSYLPDNIPLDTKFTLNQTCQTVHELQVQAKHKLIYPKWYSRQRGKTNTQRGKLKKCPTRQNKSPCNEPNQMLDGGRKNYGQKEKQLFEFITKIFDKDIYIYISGWIFEKVIDSYKPSVPSTPLPLPNFPVPSSYKNGNCLNIPTSLDNLDNIHPRK